ncbi:MAG: hypothetical protein LBR41_02085, partial [Rickettsiales bacterium]|nr:hypothetical protein [Rickettsiales bacterium]
MAQGILIAVEGADKAGKHTQSVKMVEYLRARSIAAELFGYPQYGDWFGKMAKDYLNGRFGPTRNLPAEYTMLPYALDRWSSSARVNEWLDSGRVVVLDRYVYSNVFSVAKTPRDGWAEKIDWLEDLEFNQLGLRRPDLNIYLSLPAAVSYEMRNSG